MTNLAGDLKESITKGHRSNMHRKSTSESLDFRNIYRQNL